MIVDEVSKNLNEIIIPFWKKMRDDEFGGFYGKVDSRLKLYKKTSKTCVFNSRIMWFFLQTYKLTGDEECLDCAKQAYAMLKNHFLDYEHGGLFWSVTYDGIPDDSTKYTFNMAYAIIALSSYYEIVRDREALELAMSLHAKIEEDYRDEYGYLEEAQTLQEGAGLGILAEGVYSGEKTANTVLHLIEAYTELYRVHPDKDVLSDLKRLLELYSTKIYNAQAKHLNMFFDNRMNPTADYFSFGHDIEAAWQLTKCCDILPACDYTDRVKQISSELIENIYRTAYNHNSVDDEISNGTVSNRRVFWVQAEAVIGFTDAWERNPDRTDYYEAAEAVWHFIDEFIVDKRSGGEWLHDVSVLGEHDSDSSVVGPWKCPYHNGRMCIELISRNKAHPFTERLS